jgi:hypothetical protein
MDAKWHFLAVSHGRGLYDGMGRPVERLGRRAIVVSCYEEQIMKPRQLYRWAVVKISSVSFEYCTIEDRSEGLMVFRERFRKV